LIENDITTEDVNPPPELLITRSAPLATLTINRGVARNTLSRAVLGLIVRALDDIEADPTCRVIALRGVPGVFCTGMDFAESVTSPEIDSDSATRAYMALLRRLGTIERITVAEVDGQALGGGVGVAAACDLVVASPGSSFALPEALWGLLPACVLPYLIRRVGFQRAYAMALTAQPVTAAQAERIGLIDALSDEPQVWLRQLVARAARVDAGAIGELKRHARAFWGFDDEDEQRAVELSSRLARRPEVRRGLHEFVEHRRFPWERR
jgi:polyketide biosynthesis enoyl-CoA hydratase PksH